MLQLKLPKIYEHTEKNVTLNRDEKFMVEWMVII